MLVRGRDSLISDAIGKSAKRQHMYVGVEHLRILYESANNEYIRSLIVADRGKGSNLSGMRDH